jgi:hypothetical protein
MDEMGPSTAVHGERDRRWTCCAKSADAGIYTLNDHCLRCHQPVTQADDGEHDAWYCPKKTHDIGWRKDVRGWFCVPGICSCGKSAKDCPEPKRNITTERMLADEDGQPHRHSCRCDVCMSLNASEMDGQR